MLTHRFRETILEREHSALLRLHDRLGKRAWQRLLNREPFLVFEQGDDVGVPGGRCSPTLSCVSVSTR
jgi:hypothetical protein